MEWQPIETAPKDGLEILIYYPEWNNENGVVFAAEYDSGRIGMEDIEGTWYAFHYGHTGDGATHWMPLPEPPK